VSDLSTYAGLREALADYLERADLDWRIPTFIQLAETRLDRRLNLTESETAIRLPLANGAAPLPDDFRTWRSVSPISGGRLEYVTPDAFYARWRGSWRRADGTEAGWLTDGARVADFTIVGSVPVSDYLDIPLDTWTFGLANPWILVGPALTGEVRLVYRQGIPPLGPSRPSNWLSERHPDLYLYASLLESAPFLREDARLATWRALLEEGLRDATAVDRDRRWGKARIRLSGPCP
jgi:hypothetical protein